MARQWTPDLAVGDPTIDSQHQELFRRTAALGEALAKGEGRERIGELIGYLATYTVTHFRDEEAAMASARYPALGSHRQMHAEFLREAVKVQQQYAQEGARATLMLQFYNRVNEWLVKHIGVADKEFARFRAGAGASPVSGRYVFTVASAIPPRGPQLGGRGVPPGR